MTIASLAMYPFNHLRPAYERLWGVVCTRLPFDTPPLDWDVPPDVACRRQDLVVGQTCGWPLIHDLADVVRVVGCFDCDVDGAIDGTYRSVLVSDREASLVTILSDPDLRVAANSADSLSGWVSLQAAAATNGRRLDTALWTGSHAASVEAVREGRAGLASIDAVSWSHLDQDGLSVVGRGPRVPCLPLVTAASNAPVVDALRGAFTAAISDPALAGDCAELRIRGFVHRELADYEGLSALATVG